MSREEAKQQSGGGPGIATIERMRRAPKATSTPDEELAIRPEGGHRDAERPEHPSGGTGIERGEGSPNPRASRREPGEQKEPMGEALVARNTHASPHDHWSAPEAKGVATCLR